MSLRRTRSALAALVAVAMLASCTADNADDADVENGPTLAAGTPSTAAPSRLTQPNAPLEVTIVAGRIAKGERSKVRTRVSRPIARWINGAFLTGDYPRENFPAAFVSWTPQAAKQARADRTFTTNSALAPDLTSVVADRQRAGVYVFARHGRTGGATAKVLLRLTAEKTDGSLVRSWIRGNLYLTRTGPHWRIFGYDLTRTVRGRR